MRVYSVPVPTSPTSLAVLLGSLPRHTKTVGIQAPSANVDTVFFGDHKGQPLELRPEASGSLPVATFKEVFIVGSSGDKLSVVLFDS